MRFLITVGQRNHIILLKKIACLGLLPLVSMLVIVTQVGRVRRAVTQCGLYVSCSPDKSDFLHKPILCLTNLDLFLCLLSLNLSDFTAIFERNML